MARVTPPDLELWLTGYVRGLAEAELEASVDVDTVEPPDLTLSTLTQPLIILRDDSGPLTDITTFDRSIGATVLHPVKHPPTAANDLARWLAGVLFDRQIVLAAPVPLDGGALLPCPIASVTQDGCNGPYAVPDELDVARRYMTAQYVVTGSW